MSQFICFVVILAVQEMKKANFCLKKTFFAIYFLCCLFENELCIKFTYLYIPIEREKLFQKHFLYGFYGYA
jgi:hypothetical protein